MYVMWSCTVCNSRNSYICWPNGGKRANSCKTRTKLVRKTGAKTDQTGAKTVKRAQTQKIARGGSATIVILDHVLNVFGVWVQDFWQLGLV